LRNYFQLVDQDSPATGVLQVPLESKQDMRAAFKLEGVVSQSHFNNMFRETVKEMGVQIRKKADTTGQCDICAQLDGVVVNKLRPSLIVRQQCCAKKLTGTMSHLRGKRSLLLTPTQRSTRAWKWMQPRSTNIYCPIGHKATSKNAKKSGTVQAETDCMALYFTAASCLQAKQTIA
jgi:hypothetical protein